jgi:hypothetical protein
VEGSHKYKLVKTHLSNISKNLKNTEIFHRKFGESAIMMVLRFLFALKKELLVFVIHGIIIGGIVILVALYPEAVMLWLFSLVIDFPFSLGYVLIEPFAFMLSKSYIWRFIIFPSVYFQIFGVFNWILIIYCCKCFIEYTRKV